MSGCAGWWRAPLCRGASGAGRRRHGAGTARPSREAELDTHYHYGEPVLVFDEAGGFAWCQSHFDGYVGYVEAAAS